MNSKGFSLIELMMVIIIMGVAATIVVAGYSKNRSSKALQLGAKQIASDVRMTQNYTFGSLGFVTGGYGIRFSSSTNPDKYIVFGDDGNKTYDAGEEFQTMSLPDGVTVQSLKIDSVSFSNVDVVFASPYGEVYINGVNKNGAVFVDLEIEIGNSAGTKTVAVSSSRKIE